MIRVLHNQSHYFKKGFLSLVILMVISFSGFSQNVGINSTGTAPNASAGLDVDFTNMGLLIPRVALTGTANFAPLTAHVAGMVVFNTATVGDVIPGFYYNNGTKWMTGFMSGSNSGNMLYWNGSAWMLIPVGLPGQYLQLSAASVPTWGGVSISTLSTTVASLITGNTALSGGIITSDGGSPILSRGVCWKTTSGPTIADSKTSDGAGIGTFISNIQGLLPATTYYLKAYAINSTVNVYGNEISFTTSGIVPTLAATDAATLITSSTFTSGGNVTSTNGSPILERGLCYSTTPIPTIANSKLVVPFPGIGTFSTSITGLTGNTTYYVSAYATNSFGTGYGTPITVTTLINPPTVVTSAATLITATTATAGGSYSQIGTGGTIMNTGLAYATVPNSLTPFYANNPTNISPWTSLMTGLLPGTTYYVRAYINYWGTTMTMIYGNELTFTTGIIQTTTLSAISKSSAVSGGTIVPPVGKTISARGVCWNTQTGPTIALATKTNDGTGTGVFISNITGLSASTIYFVRAYCTDNLGVTSYGDEYSFTTLAPILIGDLLYGGIVYNIDATGLHGFIASSVDLNPIGGMPWGCLGSYIGGGFFDGLANTTLITAACPTSAAQLCASYTAGGINLAAPITNWYLPCSYESATLYQSAVLLGMTGNYWTSSEYDGNNAYLNWRGDFLNKSSLCNVRAIRRF